ncbi:hypothetical protein [Halomonas llamarensis]|uniref:Uncharacterized protein n=1 Tax=Halomonas llamarensis TaxID=2945104 RepID=A0ABT0SST0_9GAMM|nr:hypothetical protein [Halomonas llamarensis]MCL7930873.1 hypothetical protein [Halomonas llamarensis]
MWVALNQRAQDLVGMDLFYFFIKFFILMFIGFVSAWLTYVFLAFLGFRNKGVQYLVMKFLVFFVAMFSVRIMQGVLWGVG